MSRDLVLRAPASAEASPSWVRLEDGRRRRSGDGMPPASETAYDRLIVVLPASELFVSRIRLATRSDREAGQAAPYLIEDDLAAPLDVTRVVTGPADGEGARWVFAARAELADSWRDLATRIDAKRTFYVPDAFAAMDEAEDAILFAEDQDLLICRPKADRPVMRIGFDLLPDTLAAALSSPKPDSLAVSRNIDWAEIVGVPLPQPRRFEAYDLAVKIAGLPQDLLAGLPGFGGKAAPSGQWLALIAPLRRAALIGLAALILGAGLLLAEGVYYSHQRNAIDEAGTELFAATFPDLRVVNPEAQLRQQIAAVSGTGGSDFLALATAVAELGRAVETVQIDSLRYDRALNVLNVSAIYADFSDFEALNAAAADLGVVLEDGGVRQSGGVLNGDFAVRLR